MFFNSEKLVKEITQTVEDNLAESQKVQIELNRIKQAKSNLKQSIEKKGVSIPENAKIDEYSSYVEQIDIEAKHFYITKTILPTEWILESNDVYAASFTDPFVQADYKLDIAFNTSDLLQLINDGISNIRADNDNGTVSVICIGAKPTANITMQISFVKLVQAE